MEGEQPMDDSERIDETHPMHEKHPDHPDYHPHRSHHPHAHNLRAILVLFMVFTLIVTFTTGLLTNAPFGQVILFFSPSVLLAIVGLGLLGSDHFDLKMLGLSMVLLIVIAAVAFSSVILGIDVAAMVGMNIVLGAILLIIIAQSHHQDPSQVVELEPEEQELPDLVKTIEDRCKAINFSIGRIYNVHHGATKGLREKLKIDSAWYNELTEALEDPVENRNLIVGALEKIRRRLDVLLQPERNVFSEAEVRNLKKLEREPDGSTTIIGVLSDNDSDPVEGFHTAAREYCSMLLDRLEA